MPEGHGALIDRACAEFFTNLTDTPLLSPNFSTEFELAQYSIATANINRWSLANRIRFKRAIVCRVLCVRASPSLSFLFFFLFHANFYTRVIKLILLGLTKTR